MFLFRIKQAEFIAETIAEKRLTRASESIDGTRGSGSTRKADNVDMIKQLGTNTYTLIIMARSHNQ